MRFENYIKNLNLIIIFASHAQNTLKILIFNKTLEVIIVLYSETFWLWMLTQWIFWLMISLKNALTRMFPKDSIKNIYHLVRKVRKRYWKQQCIVALLWGKGADYLYLFQRNITIPRNISMFIIFSTQGHQLQL